MFVIELVRGGSLLKSTYSNEAIGVIILKSILTRIEYTPYIEHAL